MKDTIMVQRANVILSISPDQKDYYLGQGYAVIDETGKVVEETTALSVEALNRKVKELQEIIKSKDAEIAKLKGSAKQGRKSNKE